MNLYYNTTAQCRVDENNVRIAAKPVLHYAACPDWVLHFYSGDPSETPVPVDLSDIVSWRAAVDSDWNSSTEPMCRTLAADIDASGKAQGIIRVPVNANTARYLAVVQGKQSVGGWFELRGFDDSGNVSTVPTIKVSWYKRAAEMGALFDSPTIIGVGDANQPEMLIGEDTLYNSIRRAVAENAGLNQTINITAPQGFDAAEAARLVRNNSRHMLARMRGGV